MNHEEKYKSLLAQIESILSKENHWISNCSNFCALIMEEFNYHWVGFYFVDKIKNQLYLGPFQGPLACTTIQYGKGVCGTAWKNKESLIVKNVHEFEGHIACSSKTNSEIVIPLIHNNEVIGVLDIDSIEFDSFEKADQAFFEEAMNILSNCFKANSF